MPKVTQLVSGGVEIWTHLIWSQSPSANILKNVPYFTGKEKARLNIVTRLVTWNIVTRFMILKGLGFELDLI